MLGPNPEELARIRASLGPESVERVERLMADALERAEAMRMAAAADHPALGILLQSQTIMRVFEMGAALGIAAGIQAIAADLERNGGGS